MKLKKILVLVILIISGNCFYPQGRNQEIIDDINDFLETIYQGYYEVEDLIDLDYKLGDMRHYEIPTEDPYETIGNSYFFVGAPTSGPQNLGNIAGIYKNGNVLWYSDVNEIGIERGYRLFTTRDINNDGKVEILISTRYSGEELWIYSWDGTTGERINDKENKWFSVIQGPFGSFTLFDAEGDGILEIRSLAERDGSESWSWNGQLYGRWLNTPIVSDISWFPRDNVIVDVNCRMTKVNNSFFYNYTVHSDSKSTQRIDYFTVECRTDSITKTQPEGWESWVHWVWNQEGWGTEIFYWNKPKEILPGQTLDSFKIESPNLPIISLYVVRGENMLPMTTEFTSEEDSADFVNNSVKGFTIGPSVLPNPFIPLNFLDTLLSYNQRSLELEWITNQATADKYDSLFNTAKTLLLGNHIPYVESTLQTVLDECNEDSSGNITSETYALLRYNTEYLLENLPEIIPPVLSSISPSLALAYDVFTSSTDLTVTASGEFFTDSSVVFFDGEQRNTTFISDTVLTFQLNNSTDIPSVNDYPVWVSTYGSNSDTLLFSVVSSLPESITPTLQCVRNNGGGSFTAYFGYNNSNTEAVFIAVGQSNHFTPGNPLSGWDRGQPKIFLPGNHTNVFSINFNGDNLTWTLDGLNVTANKKSPACP